MYQRKYCAQAGDGLEAQVVCPDLMGSRLNRRKSNSQIENAGTADAQSGGEREQSPVKTVAGQSDLGIGIPD